MLIKLYVVVALFVAIGLTAMLWIEYPITEVTQVSCYDSPSSNCIPNRESVSLTQSVVFVGYFGFYPAEYLQYSIGCNATLCPSSSFQTKSQPIFISLSYLSNFSDPSSMFAKDVIVAAKYTSNEGWSYLICDGCEIFLVGRDSSVDGIGFTYSARRTGRSLGKIPNKALQPESLDAILASLVPVKITYPLYQELSDGMFKAGLIRGNDTFHLPALSVAMEYQYEQNYSAMAGLGVGVDIGTRHFIDLTRVFKADVDGLYIVNEEEIRKVLCNVYQLSCTKSILVVFNTAILNITIITALYSVYTMLVTHFHRFNFVILNLTPLVTQVRRWLGLPPPAVQVHDRSSKRMTAMRQKLLRDPDSETETSV